MRGDPPDDRCRHPPCHRSVAETVRLGVRIRQCAPRMLQMQLSWPRTTRYSSGIPQIPDRTLLFPHRLRYAGRCLFLTLFILYFFFRFVYIAGSRPVEALSL